ncbi:hypothetical protein [Bythopirellula polymerisocia]|uniref:Uncharacterized protein n=1 Tax=Bythopirellula polymerisocia TaxID=2528003 RepID=A0A5C6CM14_9BACT|nr:hypothetical protein [Bythopirellula polymerisocia]TWU24597.1 hypothetical protein Pla144_34820 [Bythopirellula polymerisocia]
MPEVWLRSNRRVIALGLLPVALLSVAGVLLYVKAESSLLAIVAFGFLALSGLLLFVIMKQLFSPRVAYSEGYVLFYLKAGPPIAVPVHVVEAFFLGQGPAHLPLVPADSRLAINLVARLSQKETQWAEVEVKPALGRWSEGYVSIRGSWCEPLTGDLIRRLNRRLGEVSREQSAVAEATR